VEPFVRAAPIESNPIDTASAAKPKTEGVGNQGLVPLLTEINVASGVFAEAQIAPALKESKTLVPIARIIDGDSGYGSGNNSVVSEDFAVPPFKPEDETGTEIRVYLQKMHRGGSSGPQGP
jgi:hypothetical protein